MKPKECLVGPCRLPADPLLGRHETEPKVKGRGAVQGAIVGSVMARRETGPLGKRFKSAASATRWPEVVSKPVPTVPPDSRRQSTLSVMPF